MTPALSVPHSNSAAGNGDGLATLNGLPPNDLVADLSAAAANLINRGLGVIPCDGKCPCDENGLALKDWQLLPISLERVATGLRGATNPAIGLKLGPASGIIDIEADSLEEKQLFASLFDGVEVPETPTYKSARGTHYLFRWDSRFAETNAGIVNYRNGDPKIKLGIRLGADDKGAQSILPPSPGRDWLVPLSYVEPAQLPDVVIERILATAKEKTKPASSMPTGVGVHDRALRAMQASTKSMDDAADGSKRLFTAACRAVEWNLDGTAAVATIRAYEANQPFPRAYTDAEILARVRSAESTATRGSAVEPYHNTDAGNAKRFADQHGQYVRYCFPWDKWIVWDGQRWAVDSSGEVMRRAKETARSIYAEALNVVGKEDANHLGKWAAVSEGSSRLAAMIGLAKSEKPIPIAVEELDAHPWLFNCANGTIDLKTGELREHRRDDYLTKLCPVEFPIGDVADPTLWRGFLNLIFAGNQQLIQFVQRVLGASLVGQVSEHMLPIFYGSGSNGKSTLLETWSNLLGGDYSMKAPRNFLTASKNERHPTELADLRGMRFVYATETDDGGRLSESLVKELTGGDTIRARRMGEDFWQFVPSHTMVLATNHKPAVRGTDHALWRRIKLVPFTVTIPDDQADKDFKSKLSAERPEILKCIVAACLDWQRYGLGTPDAVSSATQNYRSDSDVLGKFLEECCVIAPDAKVQSRELYAAYKAWANQTYEFAYKQTDFNQRLQERGFECKKTGGVMKFKGIGLRHVGPAEQNGNN